MKLAAAVIRAAAAVIRAAAAVIVAAAEARERRELARLPAGILAWSGATAWTPCLCRRTFNAVTGSWGTDTGGCAYHGPVPLMVVMNRDRP